MIEYKLPFPQGAHVLELGGGDKPLFHPNADVRPLPTVDIVCDLNKPLPIPAREFEGVYCRYFLEHLSWRNVRPFLSEVHRVLAYGGIAVFITANLLEQARVLLSTPQWDDRLICGIFGDQDYPENSHKCGFSPEYITRLLREVGFHSVNVLSIYTEVGPTDMIAEAVKSRAEVFVGS